MEVHHDTSNIKLTSGEIAELFNSYLTNSVSICVLSYFIAKVEDPDIKLILMRAKGLSESYITTITNIYKGENHPIPKAFSDEDVNVTAAKLYSDIFMATYVRFMARFALISYAEARASSTRADVREFFDNAIHSATDLFDMADNVLIDKGLLSKPPYMPIPDRIEFIQRQSFLNGFLGEKRSLNASEANRLHLNFQRNALGEALLTGFIQTAKNKKVRDYLVRGLEISKHHMEVSSSLLKEDNLSIPKTLVQEVTDSREIVFSDKLMIFHVSALDALGFSTTGTSVSRVMRNDLSAALTRQMAEIALYAEDGVNLMIENQWLEQIPQTIDRKELVSK